MAIEEDEKAPDTPSPIPVLVQKINLIETEIDSPTLRFTCEKIEGRETAFADDDLKMRQNVQNTHASQAINA